MKHEGSFHADQAANPSVRFDPRRGKPICAPTRGRGGRRHGGRRADSVGYENPRGQGLM